ncbi:YcxB family protein [Leptospira stimsonii]|uniref:YcxB family protein n=1 Tax=Leptospira stimsonii TaxID=2202203 RepID=A0ABY2N3G0_9LEPT|nr:YcxB family protein [Leptospira stimsonii]TGK22813.1 YcxB family protein [Leptospira stimsonii]TGM14985.1 YcxB family protein [Leptospira stimsonii]
MQITYELTLEDIVNFNEYHFRHSEVSKKKRMIAKLIIPIWTLFVFLALNYTNLENIDEISFLLNIPIFIFAIAWFFLFDRLYFWRLRNNVDKMLREKENKGMIGKQKITLSKDQLLFETSFTSAQFKPGSISEVIETRDYFFLYVSSLNALIVPQGSFQASEKKEFLEKLQSFVI